MASRLEMEERMKRLFSPESKLGYLLMTWFFRAKDLFGKPDGKLDAFAIAPESVVVDYGCGPGRYIRKASQQVGPGGLVYAADIHPLAIAILRRKIGTFGLQNVRPVHLDREPSAIADHCADTVYALDMFHQIKDPAAFLKGIHRIIKTDGRLFLEDGHQPRESTLEKVRTSKLWRVETETPRHLVLVPV